MHFTKKDDVLDKTQTGSSLMNPVIKTESLSERDVFVYLEYDPSVFCISEKVREEFEANLITGCSYQKITR
ncbi:hypothetical protein PDL71_06710 [Lacibacter sp. MH-610]|uniref:hypothetical protein n=1 Tax=Lacibacter sp. MH-610 TaxID=3020883 RepID=UPI0038913C4F